MGIDAIREATEDELGLCIDFSDYAVIFDSDGYAWQTETLASGEQVKRPCSCPWIIQPRKKPKGEAQELA